MGSSHSRFARAIVRPILEDERGATILETVIVFSILTMSALAILPLFVDIRTVGKSSRVQSLCSTIVRSKLEEYRAGRPIPNSEINSSASYLKRLGFPSVSGSAAGFTGVMGEDGQLRESQFSGGMGGFFYSKWRYNRYFPASCRGVSKASLLASRPSQDKTLGMRECVGSQDSFGESDTEGDICESIAVDQQLRSELPGFKLYVKLERLNHWRFSSEEWKSNPEFAERFDPSCPVFNGGKFKKSGDGPLYDFDASGDTIQVTVTGVVDFPSRLKDAKEFAGASISDPSFFTCSASSVISPPSYPFRFLRRSAEWIRGWSGRSGDSGAKLPFRELFQLDNPTESPDSIIAFVAHSLNASFYFLKQGQLFRFSDCGGVPLDCIASDSGLTDSGEVQEQSSENYTVANGIVGMGVDFSRSPSWVYVFSDRLNDVQRLKLDPESRVATAVSLMQESDEVTDSIFRPWLKWARNPNGFGFADGRVSSVFMDPSGSEVFISDRASTAVDQGGINFYRLGDAKMLTPVMRVPAGTVSFAR